MSADVSENQLEQTEKEGNTSQHRTPSGFWNPVYIRYCPLQLTSEYIQDVGLLKVATLAQVTPC